MTNILNPYIAGAPVVETSMFFGREDIFGWIERSLTGKFVNHILVLHGQRRVGKTSVLKQIPRHLPKHYIQVFFDLQGRTNTTMDRFLWWMASEISRTLKKEYNLDLPKIERNAFADPEAFINDFLPSLREQLQEKILLLTFDEFDTLDRPDIQDSLARPLIAYLRRLMEIEGLNFIFSIGSSGNKLENMQASYTDFFKSALYRKVSFLTKDDCMRLITKPVEGTIAYESAAVDKISHFTSGHPYFTQLMCHELFSRCQKTGSRTITAQDVDSILEDVIERGTVNLKFVWDEASDLEKWILAALAQEEFASLKRAHQILKGQGVRSGEAELNSAILHLRDKDVLNADNGFVIQLMKLWLQTNRPMDRVREELVQSNPIVERYLEIGDEYRERGENQQAIQSYEQALAAQSNNIRALSSIAAIHMMEMSYQPAAETFTKILRIDDENIAAKQGFSQAQMAIAQNELRAGREDQAEKAWKSIMLAYPGHAEALKQLTDLYVRQAESQLENGLEEPAMEKFRQAMELSPEDASIRMRYEKIIADKKAAQVQVWLEKAEKSLARQRWDEAASMVDEALNIDPENPELQKRLLEIKDTPRQEKIKVYKREAEQAIAKGNYPKAISAIQTAIMLAPEDSSLKQWIDSIQSDQANAQLRMYQSQADQAEAAGNWEAAIAAREAALKLDPQNERSAKALQKTKDAKQKQQINSLRLKIDQAKKEQKWEAALVAGEEYLQLSPDDQDVKNDLENFRIEQRKSRLASLKTQAQSASKAEKWEDAIQHWQTYLAEQPEDGARVETLIDQAKQKAVLLKDYETAQTHIRKHQYNRAIHLLQGIIAKDPTYKSSSRLLVEAVEANKQKKPIWKTPWIYVGGGVLILAVLVVIMLPQIKNWINPSNEPTPVVGVMETQTASGASVFVPNPFGYALDRRVWYQISESGPSLALTKKATFQDYFDERNPQPYWQTLLNDNHIYLVSDMFKIYDGAWYTNEFLIAKNFLIEFDYFTENGLENNITHIDINSGTEIYYRFSISNNGRYKERINSVEGEWKLVPNWTSYKLENENTIKVKLIKNENEMTVFVNEVPLVYHKEYIEDQNPQVILNFEGDQNRSVIWLQSIRFWNLDVPDFLYSLISNIDNINPTFQDDFDIFSPLPYWDTLITNQKIIPRGNVWEMYANSKYVNQNLRAKDFIFEFEYNPQNYDPDSYVNIVLSRGHYYSFSLSNNGEFIEYLYGNKSSGKAIQNWEEFLANNDYIIKIRIIASNNTLAILVNDQTVVFQNDDNLNDEVIPIINILSSNENEPVVILRNIKYWNLTENNSIHSIMTYIESNPPTFEDDFSTAKEEWGKISFNQGTMGGEEMILVEHQISDFIQNEKLEFKIDVDQRGYITFPTDGFLDANQFIIKFEYKINHNSIAPDNDLFGFKFHQSTEKDSYYDLNFSGNGNWQLVDNKISNDKLAILNLGTFTKLDTQSVLIAVYKGNLIVAINDQIVAQVERITSIDYSNSFYYTATGNFIMTMDNIQFWNLDGVEINPEDTESQTNQSDNNPDWVTNFVDPVNSFIENRPPDIEDNFDTASSAWVLTINNYPGWNKSFEDGEMIVNGVVENTMITYHDYMVDVDFRHINGISAGIAFDNGSAVYCQVLVGRRGGSVNISCSDPTSFELPLTEEIVNLRLIVKGSKIAVIVNQQPVAYIEDEPFKLYRGVNPMVSLTTNQQGTIAFSNFRVWNLTQLEIP